MNLNSIMQFDHVVRVAPDGTVTDRVDGVWAPEIHIDTDDDGQILDQHERDMVEYVRSQGWELETGWTGQYLAKGSPVMHTSEFIGGALADHILATPGLWVACVVDTDNPECRDDVEGCVISSRCQGCEDNGREREGAGWVLAFREENTS